MTDAVPHIVAYLIVEEGAAVIANGDTPTDTLRMETVAHERDGDVHIRQTRHPHRMRNAKSLQGDAGKDGMNRRGFELETNRAIVRHGVEKMVGINGLRCS